MKDKIDKLFDLYPLDLQDPTAISTIMKEGLARMYADEGIRKYLENAVRIQNANLVKAARAGLSDKSMEFSVKVETLMQLLAKGRECYHNIEKIRKESEVKRNEKENEKR